MSGYVKAYRERFNHSLFRNEKFCRGYAWDWMVAKARYETDEYDIKGRTIVVQRGQFFASPDEMARAWNWSRSAVNRFLARLQTEQMIGLSTGHKKTLITICNYAEYQGEAGHQSGHQIGQEADRGRTPKKKGRREEPSQTTSSRGTRLPENWRLPRDWGQWALERDWTEEAVRAEAEKFSDYWISKAGAAARKADWRRTWQSWVRRSEESRPRQTNHKAKTNDLLSAIDAAAADADRDFAMDSGQGGHASQPLLPAGPAAGSDTSGPDGLGEDPSPPATTGHLRLVRCVSEGPAEATAHTRGHSQQVSRMDGAQDPYTHPAPGTTY